MEKRSDSFESSLRALAAEARQELGEHPAVEELTAYHAGELEGAAREQLRDHLALCPECTGLLLDLASFGTEAPDGEEQRPAARVLPFEPRAADPPPRVETVIPAWYHAVAAVLVAAVAGLMLWGVGLRQHVAELSGPRVLVDIRDLEPQTDAKRMEGDRDRLRFSVSAEHYLLNLTLFESRSFSTYRLQVHDGSGALVWREEVPRRSAYGHLAVEVPRDFLTPGTYEFRLFGLGDAEPELLAAYALPIAYE